MRHILILFWSLGLVLLAARAYAAPDEVRVGGLNATLNETEFFTAMKGGFSCNAELIDWCVSNGAVIIKANGETLPTPVASIDGMRTIVVRYDQASTTIQRNGSVDIKAEYPAGTQNPQEQHQYRTVVKVNTISIGPAVSDNNNKKDDWLAWAWPVSNQTLGALTAYYRSELNEGKGWAFVGCGYEASGATTPGDYEGTVSLVRKASGGAKTYSDTDDGSTLSSELQAGADDSSGADWLDMIAPQVYDIDVVGAGACPIAIDSDTWIERMRCNFSEYAYLVDRELPCSLSTVFKVAASQKQKAAADGTRTMQLATAGLCGDTTIGTTGRTWAVDCWKGGVVRIVSGTGIDQIRKVSGNTATTLTVSAGWDPDPNGTSWYTVEKTGWAVEDTFDEQGDNCNAANGALDHITWDLQEEE